MGQPVSRVQRAVMAAITSGTLIASMHAGLPRADGWHSCQNFCRQGLHGKRL